MSVTGLDTGHNVFVTKVGNNFGYVAEVRTAFGRLVGTTEVYGTPGAALRFAVDIAEADVAAARVVTA